MLFATIPHDGGAETLKRASDAILQRASVRELRSRKWSLTELGLDEDDYRWLRAWAECLDRSFIEVFVRSLERRAQFGLIFLLFCAEVGRREALPGTIWDPIREALSRSTAQYLFPSRGPQAIEAAARRYGLRHVFDIEGGKNWMVTIHLQFGLHQANLSNLGAWLSGYSLTEATEHLLGRNPLSGLRSDTFLKLVRDLKQARQSVITNSEALRRLEGCPWILKGSAPGLLAAARRSARLDGEREAGDGDAPAPFAGAPRLSIGGQNGPQFEVPLINLDAQPWPGRSADILQEERIVATLVKRDDGTWSSLGAAHVVLSVNKPITNLAWRTPEGVLVAQTEIPLWDAGALVNLYDAEGRLVPSGRLHPGRDGWIVAAHDLSLTPEPDVWHECGGYRFYGYLPLPDQDLVLTHGGIEVWSTRCPVAKPTAAVSEPPIRGGWAETSTIHPSELPSIRLALPEGQELFFARALGVPLEIRREGTGWEVGPLPSVAGALPARVHLQIGFGSADGIQTKRVELNAERLRRAGSIALREGVWHDSRDLEALTVVEAASIPLKVFPSLTERGYLFEGDAWVGQYHHHRRSSAYGWGGPLVLHRRLYNLQPGERHWIVPSVVDPGIVEGVQWAEGFLTLVCPQLQELDPQRHRITLWLPDQTLQTVQADFRISLSAEPIAVVLSYEGRRIGAWWRLDWAEHLNSGTLDPASSGPIAAFLRWAQLPLASKAVRPALRQLLAVMPGRVLRAWLQDEFLPEPLEWNEEEKGWREVVGGCLMKWDSAPHVTRLLRNLGGERSDPWVVADRLRSVSPLVAAKFLRAALTERRSQALHDEWGIAPEEELLEQIEALGEMGVGIDSGMVQHPKLGLRALARQWCAAPESLSPLQSGNLRTAQFCLTPFRDLLTFDLLEGRL